jgi:hypothetical protein
MVVIGTTKKTTKGATKERTPITNIQHCNFVAEAGKIQSPEVVGAVTRLADALVAQAKAVSDLSFMLKGTTNGIMQTGIYLEGSK